MAANLCAHMGAYICIYIYIRAHLLRFQQDLHFKLRKGPQSAASAAKAALKGLQSSAPATKSAVKVKTQNGDWGPGAGLVGAVPVRVSACMHVSIHKSSGLAVETVKIQTAMSGEDMLTADVHRKDCLLHTIRCAVSSAYH